MVRRLREFVRRQQRALRELLLVFIVALVPRLYGIGLFITADEKNWLGRSYEFLKAFSEFRINDTLQTTHPGITTLWVSGVATFIATRVLRLPFSFDELQRFVEFVAVPMAVVNTILVCGIFLAARRVFSERVALFGALVIALDPLLVAHGKIIHVDGFLSGFLALAVLLTISAKQSQSAWVLLASVLASALAILSKLPAMLIIPFAFFVFLGGPGLWETLPSRFRMFVRWLFTLTVLVLLLWPALLWVENPAGNVNLVRRDMATAIFTPHNMEEAYTLNLWHYPKTLLSRLSLPVIVGVAIVLLFLVVPPLRVFLRRFSLLSTLLLLLTFVLAFLVMMTLGAKKGDRYVLPVFPLLDIVSVVGILAGVEALLRLWRRPATGVVVPARAPTVAIGAALLFVPMIIILVRLGPYALAYFNPLLPPDFSQELGWGEGLDQVAAYLNGQDDDSVVASWYPEELRALTTKPVTHINAHEQIQTGYVVLYRNMFGRPPDHWANDFIDEYYQKRTPAFTARVNGLPYAWVYKKPALTVALPELLPGTAVIAELPATQNGLSRVDVFTATYNGRATAGRMRLAVRRQPHGTDLRSAVRDVHTLPDNGYAAFTFAPVEDSAEKLLYVVLTTEGTAPENAPTVRVAPQEKGKRYALVRGEITEGTYAAQQKPGSVGLRWFYRQNGEDVLDERSLSSRP